MKICEKKYNEKVITKYKLNNINSFKDVMQFLKLIKSKGYYFSSVEFMDTENSLDDGNETFNINLDSFDYDEVEKKYLSSSISAIGIDIIIEKMILSVLVNKNYEVDVISYDDSRELFKKFEKEIALLEE